MPIRKRFETREPVNYLGVVEEVVDADPRNGRTRSFILLDCVRADRFAEMGPQILEDRSALALVRAMSTPKRWEERFGLGDLGKGDWLSFRLDDSGDIPRAWELRADRNYLAGPSRSISAMRRINGPGVLQQPGDAELVMKLMATATLPMQGRKRVPASRIVHRLRGSGDVEIVVLDVGQASAALIKRNGRAIGFFDVGAPLWFNNGSLPQPMTHPVISGGFVLLSHWDWDHFDLGRRHTPYRQLDWFAPDQPIGPNTARFQADLGDKLTFIDGPASFAGFTLARGTATGVNDRNGSGYQLRYEKDGRAVLLTGDTSYDLIQAHMLAGVGGLTIPHHGGRSDAATPLAIDQKRAIASYGDRNSYRHPHAQTIADHDGQGWQIQRTATTPTRPRGNRRLYP
ncbi:Metal-dependent hydrolase, beta-lactamase superfamily II [Sphingomonas sp. EC-HK361]|uniref:hypothetical protein n=1 Tax=Sphingomonas sp. EC-HK361 TaxID=2038397 RepID=UPI001251C291|nr:hypothetical protein [Sphingomonas sp. EC-HK361]VVT10208.1 Metal-dependent hydrolase, beta-lactamase superfamily II [Sphingomonas sp. EC-HK361]